MTLMWLPLGGPKELRGAQLRRTVQTLLTSVYGLGDDDELLAENLRTIEC
jgi:hypothetical protein